MDIGNTVTVRYQLKRGNYAVDCNNRSNSDIYINVTSTSNFTVADHGQTHHAIGQGSSDRTCDKHSNNGQERSSLCEEDRVQGEPIQRGLTQQIEWSTWSVAVTLGKTRVVTTQTNIRSTQVCAPSLRHLVRSVQVPSGKELVLANEPA
jgi:hypothetical protein